MTAQMTIPSLESSERIRIIHKSIQRVMLNLKSKIVNSSYILLDGNIREAYGYYTFPNIGAVFTTLSLSHDNRVLFHVNIVGFEKDIKKYFLVRENLEGLLNKKGLNRIKRE